MSDNDVDSTPADEVSSEAAATPGKDAASSGTGAGVQELASGGAGGSAETVKTRKSSDEAVVAESAGTSPAVSRGKLVAAGSIGAIALGAAVGAAGYFFVQNSGNEALLAAHEEARRAACDYAPRLADYDAKNLDVYFAAVLDGATGDWHQQFDDTSRELREVLTEGQVVSKVQHVECAIKTGDETSAEAVIMIGQTITSVGTQGQASPGQLSMVLRMEKTDGRWLVNQVDSPLPAPQQ